MNYRVLIADDDIAVRDALKAVLEGAGYEVLTAADGAEAESKINGEPIHLLLLDLGLPRQNGWNVLGLVTAQNPLLPVIIITGRSDCAESPRICAPRNLCSPCEPLWKTSSHLIDQCTPRRI
jgi:DNA-binding response OmpR family regulator